MARRAYSEYARQHSAMGMRFPPWDQLTIAVRANWKLIIAKALGQHTDVININRMERKPFSVIVTGFTQFGASTFRQGMEAKLEAQKASMESITNDVSEPPAEDPPADDDPPEVSGDG